MAKTLQGKMFEEMELKEIFSQAKEYAFDYADKSLDRNVFPSDDAIENLSRFAETMPGHTGDAKQILKQLHEYGSPASVSQIGGRYFGLVNGGAIPASLAARWLSDFWDQNTPLYLTSPIASKLEEVTEEWLKDLLGLPDSVVAGFVSGSSMAIFCGRDDDFYPAIPGDYFPCPVVVPVATSRLLRLACRDLSIVLRVRRSRVHALRFWLIALAEHRHFR